MQTANNDCRSPTFQDDLFTCACCGVILISLTLTLALWVPRCMINVPVIDQNASSVLGVQNPTVTPFRGLRVSRRRFSASLIASALAFLRDHAVAGRPLCPAAAFLEAAVESGRMLKEDGSSGWLLLHGATFSKALLLSRCAKIP